MSFIFNAIVTGVVGGVLLTGGFGSIIGIFFGKLTLAIVSQDIYFTRFDANWSSLIIGVLLLLAVLMNNTFRKMALTYSPKKGKKWCPRRSSSCATSTSPSDRSTSCATSR